MARLAIAPPDLADRLETLLLGGEAVFEELERLIGETAAIVAERVPGVETPLRRPLGSREEPWP